MQVSGGSYSSCSRNAAVNSKKNGRGDSDNIPAVCKVQDHAALLSHIPALQPLPQTEPGPTEPTLLKVFCVRVSVDERAPPAMEVTQHVRQRLCNSMQEAGRRELVSKVSNLLGASSNVNKRRVSSVARGPSSGLTCWPADCRLTMTNCSL